MAGDAIDYAELAEDAQGLIEDNGRLCTFARIGLTPADADKPWRAPSTDPMAASPSLSLTAIAVIVPDEREPEKKEIARRSTATLYVAHNSFATPVPDISTFDTVDDGDITWTIEKIEPIKPGTVTIIYTMYLRS